MLIPLGFLAGSGAGFESDFELIETQTLGSTQASIIFSNLGTYSSTYKHLQVRALVRDNRAIGVNVLAGRFNGDTGNNYTGHGLVGNGSTVTAFRTSEVDYLHAGLGAGANATSGEYSATVLDILDAYSTSKYKVTRSLTGVAGGPSVRLYSGLWLNTASITSVTLFDTTASLVAGTRISIYGTKG